MNKTGIPYLDFTWNPLVGCTRHCPGCWAEKCAKRVGANIGCPACTAFTPHIHLERLGQPTKRKAPAVIGPCLMGDMFDSHHDESSNIIVFANMCYAPQHTYVLLTQQVRRMRSWATRHNFACPNWYWGMTVRNQQEFDTRWPVFRDIPGPKWLSIEPIQARMEIWDALDHTAGVVVGCDNRKSEPWDNAWAADIVRQCRDAQVPVFVKQLRIDGRLVTDPGQFPPDLQIRQLPWSLTTKEP